MLLVIEKKAEAAGDDESDKRAHTEYRQHLASQTLGFPAVAGTAS